MINWFFFFFYKDEKEIYGKSIVFKQTMLEQLNHMPEKKMERKTKKKGKTLDSYCTLCTKLIEKGILNLKQDTRLEAWKAQKQIFVTLGLATVFFF